MTMLVELEIRDFAIVERLRVPFQPGLNVLTGETGAGKSIIIDALSAALGARMGPDVIRAGQAAARVDAVFDLSGLERSVRDRLMTVLAELGLEAEEDVLVLSREVQAAGRSLGRVGGRLTPVSTLQRIGELLVDIHGQGDHISLFRPATQLDLLDRYAGVGELRAEVAAAVARLRAILRERAALLADEREIARRIDLLRFQVEEIASAALRPNEDDELEAEHRVLASAEKLEKLAGAAYDALDRAGEALSNALADLRHAAAIDRAAQPLEEAAIHAAEALDDLARQVRLYQERVEADPARLAAVEERLRLLMDLRRKYGPTVRDILDFGTRAAAELAELERRTERRDELGAEEARERERLSCVAQELSARRHEAADRLAREVEAELASLGLRQARFAVELRRLPDPEGIVVEGAAVAYDESGVDRIQFLLSANPGSPLRPLDRVASGGETARIMLGLKSVLGRLDRVPTLIFDEVDVGIGGRTGRVVGQKLWGLTRGHQVICITHLPQVASFADHHLSIVKLTDDGRTGVRVEALDPAGRKRELAQMLGGVAAAIQNAEELLERAEEWKRAQTVRT
ncbi:MAG: DNA repair protein RecN [Chloroflexota bacterium]|nr:DNA repair protein RecN [Dehalococcoidia bacterium]MDW8253571.1 DNA repair protein RecN [Chloroflexota bacterium]